MAKTYDIAFKLAAKLDKTYGNTFAKAESIANNVTKSIGNMAAKATTAVVSAVGIKDTVDKAMKFESAMADVAKVVDGLRDDTGQITAAYTTMSDKILGMTSRLPMAAEDLAQITAAAGQANIASEDLITFTETAAKMGVAFDVSASQAGEWMAQWRTSFSMSQQEVTTLSDQINY